ncbi:glycosyltransferase family 9 protein [Noviherbaspirillum denitrificans]|uniref:Glycosyl transferase n=1 Tax=Noviherbaspirillum denitrificans TaxID=1968433 RepID=A0A254TFL0_9BURK|nr:glycosyltransferase family 9 protein [Noviherbaspirillum denitrificans]OWW21400.1 glycosyl transferase [Noviherbaspirillum denitrificans]
MTDFPLLPGVRRIAFLRPSAVGDFVFALPSLHALRVAYPDARITYIGRQWHADFLANRPGPVDEVEVLPPIPGIGLPPDARVDPLPVRHFIERMRDARYDIALQAYGGGLYSNPFLMEFAARLTAGMRAPEAAALDRWVSYGPLQNRRLQLLEVASLTGATTVRFGRELHVTAEDRREAAHVLDTIGKRPLVVLQPGASDPRRRWPAERYAALADILAREGAMVAINGSAEEAGIVAAVLERMRQPALNLAGQLSLSGLCGLLERASLVISNDTGPLHLALAIGTPAVGIYWLTNLLESAPLRQDHHRAAMSLRVHCQVCGAENLKTRCPHDESFVDGATVEEVSELALSLYRE